MASKATCSQLKAVWLAARPPFLLLTLAVMALTFAVVDQAMFSAHVSYWVLVLWLALAAHISVNLLNEYDDALSSLDEMTARTPFSGGSGALQACPQAAGLVARVAWFLVGMIAAAGLFLVVSQQGALFWFGLVGLGLVVFYTRYLTHRPFVMLIAPGLAFGPVMMLGPELLLTGRVSWTMVMLSLMVFFLVNNLLLLNQFPDAAADARVGRVSLPMWLGTAASGTVFVQFLGLSYASLAVAILLGELPLLAALGFVTLLLALPLGWRVLRDHCNLSQLRPILGWNVAVVLLTPALVATGIWMGGMQ
ncbi:MAG: prenyltransferase [Hydrogenovibrio sp.]|uniref:prenyltransferase n=1 Tax=Hydrogenovibrio sp. TaxID=2065821 RepID=UPI0028707DCF|nr:prenyltransferase [Hydrogenovibrio sp.]MDR9497602.1 prenyltransferase [Hydrogenovibrio sp.]